MQCQKCNQENELNSKFCVYCGFKFGGEIEKAQTITPAKQTGQVVKKANQAINKMKIMWLGFSLPEKIITVGALLLLISFFLPWLNGSAVNNINDFTGSKGDGFSGVDGVKISSLYYLYLIAPAVSLVLMYFTQGASNTKKILVARWQIVIGAIFSNIAIGGIFIMYYLIEQINKISGAFKTEIDIGIGWWIFVIGALSLLVGAFKLQKKLVSEK